MIIRRDPPGPLDRPIIDPDDVRVSQSVDQLQKQIDKQFEQQKGDSQAQAETAAAAVAQTVDRSPISRKPSALNSNPAEVPDPAVVEVPADLRAEIEQFMSRYPDSRSAAIPALAAAQRLHGWCSPQAIEQVACVMRLTPGYLTAVVGFYDMLEGKPVGSKTVYVCTNISCSLRGADELLAELKSQIGDDADVNIRGFECLGACDIAPMCSVDGVYVGPVENSEIPLLAEQIKAGEDPLPNKQLVKRKLADTAANSDQVNAESGQAYPIDPVSHGGAA